VRHFNPPLEGGSKDPSAAKDFSGRGNAQTGPLPEAVFALARKSAFDPRPLSRSRPSRGGLLFSDMPKAGLHSCASPLRRKATAGERKPAIAGDRQAPLLFLRPYGSRVLRLAHLSWSRCATRLRMKQRQAAARLDPFGCTRGMASKPCMNSRRGGSGLSRKALRRSIGRPSPVFQRPLTRCGKRTTNLQGRRRSQNMTSARRIITRG